MAMTPQDALPEIDLDRYDIPGLMRDIAEIVDVGRLFGTVARWLFFVPVVGAWVLWNVFGGLAIGFRLPYVGLLVVSLVLASIGFAAFGILRSRIVEVNAAADRLIPTLGSIHADVLKVNSGGAAIPKSELAVLIVTQVLVPALKEAAVTAGAVAGIAAGPAFIASRLSGAVIGAVQRRLVRVIEDEPEPYEVPVVEEGHVLEPYEANDAVAAMLMSELPGELSAFYSPLHQHFVRIVSGVTNVTVGPAKAVVVASALPFVLLLLLGLIIIT